MWIMFFQERTTGRYFEGLTGGEGQWLTKLKMCSAFIHPVWLALHWLPAGAIFKKSPTKLPVTMKKGDTVFPVAEKASDKVNNFLHSADSDLLVYLQPRWAELSQVLARLFYLFISVHLPPVPIRLQSITSFNLSKYLNIMLVTSWSPNDAYCLRVEQQKGFMFLEGLCIFSYPSSFQGFLFITYSMEQSLSWEANWFCS